MQVSILHYAVAWYEALKTADDEDQAAISQRMLKRLQMQGKLAWLARIVKQVQELEDADLGVVDVKIKLANKVSVKDIEPIVKDLLQIEKVRLTIKEDKDLLGGMVVQTSDKRWDVSMKKQLADLKQSLK